MRVCIYDDDAYAEVIYPTWCWDIYIIEKKKSPHEIIAHIIIIISIIINQKDDFGVESKLDFIILLTFLHTAALIVV